ncbi:MAG: hypothetical protein J6A23_08820, partial [Thermoguttaceae bacterium]|nr:hypothetical protein [Thermoguttaceae bacterium]
SVEVLKIDDFNKNERMMDLVRFLNTRPNYDKLVFVTSDELQELVRAMESQHRPKAMKIKSMARKGKCAFIQDKEGNICQFLSLQAKDPSIDTFDSFVVWRSGEFQNFND